MTDPDGKAPIFQFSYAPRGPYSLAATAARFTRWPEVVDRFDGRTDRRLLPIGRRGVLLEARQNGRRAPLRVTLSGPGARAEAARPTRRSPVGRRSFRKRRRAYDSPHT